MMCTRGNTSPTPSARHTTSNASEHATKLTNSHPAPMRMPTRPMRLMTTRRTKSASSVTTTMNAMIPMICRHRQFSCGADPCHCVAMDRPMGVRTDRITWGHRHALPETRTGVMRKQSEEEMEWICAGLMGEPMWVSAKRDCSWHARDKASSSFVSSARRLRYTGPVW